MKGRTKEQRELIDFKIKKTGDKSQNGQQFQGLETRL
jgi:hypothetical protein